MNLRETIADNLIFIMAHRAWFAMQRWTLTAKPVEICEGGKSSGSYLTLVFERQGDAWLMVQDQNTPIQ